MYLFVYCILLGIQTTALLAALVHPNDIVYRGSLGLSRLPPPCDSNERAVYILK